MSASERKKRTLEKVKASLDGVYKSMDLAEAQGKMFITYSDDLNDEQLDMLDIEGYDVRDHNDFWRISWEDA